jgi:polyvinyl alcohol dehydrogenase (cytochrome)
MLYVTTGNNYSLPATETSDAILAFHLYTGRMAWAKQLRPGDAFNSSCGRGPNCPQERGPDYDFGASAMLAPLADGRSLLVAGQKSGMVYALDPDRKGEIVWQTRVGRGGAIGGVQWGMATDGQQVYAAVSDVVPIPKMNPDPFDARPFNLLPGAGGGLTALRLNDGSKVWYAAPSSICDSKPGCSPAQSAAVTAIPGVVFSGSLDGHLRAFAVEDGKLLWDIDTARDYETVNGVKGRGGSLDGPGAVVVGGMVFVNSGYARFGGMPGNVLLAFAPDKSPGER